MDNTAAGGSGLEPRKLETEVQINVESDRVNEQPEQQVEAPVQEAQATQPEQALEQDSQPDETQREANRVQTLANQAAQARAEAEQYKAMLQNLVSAQTQAPTLSQDEVLAKTYKSFDANLGYPTDPKEYAAFNREQAVQAAKAAAYEASNQLVEQQQMTELIKAYPDIGQDPALYGAMVAERSAQGNKISYKDAADIATKKLQKRFAQVVKAEAEKEQAEKGAAYVETSRGASSNRGTNVDPKNMSLTEMESLLKQSGNW
jgi:hypothetical protein